MATRLIPTANPDIPGDLPDPWEAFLDGTLDYEDLDPALQEAARSLGYA
jgi:hypothetical protein